MVIVRHEITFVHEGADIVAVKSGGHAGRFDSLVSFRGEKRMSELAQSDPVPRGRYVSVTIWNGLAFVAGHVSRQQGEPIRGRLTNETDIPLGEKAARVAAEGLSAGLECAHGFTRRHCQRAFDARLSRDRPGF